MMNAAMSAPDYQIQLTTSKRAELVEAQREFKPAFPESIASARVSLREEWIIWRFPASSMILSKISPEIEPKQNNVLPREIELYWMRQHANRRGCPGPPEVGVYTRNDASMKVSYDILSIPLIPIIHQNRGLFHILFSESPRSFDHGLSWPFQCSWVCLPFISIPTCFSWDFWSWINSDHGSP